MRPNRPKRLTLIGIFEGIPVFPPLQEIVKKLFTTQQLLVKKLAFPHPE
jgi:hypothetical protein